MTAESLSLFAGAVLSLAFSYVPKLNTWFDGLEPTTKRLVMLALLLAVAGVSFGLGCLGWFGVPITCDQKGIEELVRAFILAAVANQGLYALTKRADFPR